MECLPQQAFHFSVSSVRSSPITLEKSAQVFLFSSCFMMGEARSLLLKTGREIMPTYRFRVSSPLHADYKLQTNMPLEAEIKSNLSAVCLGQLMLRC
jgi:hypothetical protein